MARLFAFGTVAFEALSSTVMAAQGSFEGATLATQSFLGVLTVLPVSCLIARHILARGSWQVEEQQLS